MRALAASDSDRFRTVICSGYVIGFFIGVYVSGDLDALGSGLS
jgi:hypothetical protein